MVAQRLKSGLSVEPHLYASATVLFTDICSFTRLCSHSTPLQIITLLNGLFVAFDAIITANDAYKVGWSLCDVPAQVETIGDCYMAVSGLPHENANNASIMAKIAIGIRSTVDATRIVHMADDYRLQMRIGLCTGPVATGVIGLHAPRYCLFGDTVGSWSFSYFCR